MHSCRTLCRMPNVGIRLRGANPRWWVRWNRYEAAHVLSRHEPGFCVCVCVCILACSKKTLTKGRMIHLSDWDCNSGRVRAGRPRTQQPLGDPEQDVWSGGPSVCIKRIENIKGGAPWFGTLKHPRLSLHVLCSSDMFDILAEAVHVRTFLCLDVWATRVEPHSAAMSRVA